MGQDERTSVSDRLSGGRLLARNAGFSFAGHGVTLIVAFFAVPPAGCPRVTAR